MKSIILAFAITIGAIQGCAPVAKFIGGDSVAEVAPVTIVVAEKSLTIAHLAYDGLGISLKAAAESGVLRGTNAATAKCWYDLAGDKLIAADAADKALNASGVMAAIGEAQNAIVQSKAPTAACAR